MFEKDCWWLGGEKLGGGRKESRILLHYSRQEEPELKKSPWGGEKEKEWRPPPKCQDTHCLLSLPLYLPQTQRWHNSPPQASCHLRFATDSSLFFMNHYSRPSSCSAFSSLASSSPTQPVSPELLWHCLWSDGELSFTLSLNLQCLALYLTQKRQMNKYTLYLSFLSLSFLEWMKRGWEVLSQCIILRINVIFFFKGDKRVLQVALCNVPGRK